MGTAAKALYACFTLAGSSSGEGGWGKSHSEVGQLSHAATAQTHRRILQPPLTHSPILLWKELCLPHPLWNRTLTEQGPPLPLGDGESLGQA